MIIFVDADAGTSTGAVERRNICLGNSSISQDVGLAVPLIVNRRLFDVGEYFQDPTGAVLFARSKC